MAVQLPSPPQKIRILSLDGGGLKGIITGKVLVSLEKKLQAVTHNPLARLADYFDLIAGTSTGGLLAFLCLTPSMSEPKRPQFSADDGVYLYTHYGAQIFDRSVWDLLTLKEYRDAKYDAENLTLLLHHYFAETRLSDLLKPCLITAYDIARRQAKFFTQHDAQRGARHDFYVRDAARATSAAPTFFEPALIEALSGTRYPLIDGGVFANNPALCAYAEVLAHEAVFGPATTPEIALLSIGTGLAKESFMYHKAKDWGALGWARPVLQIILSGVGETVDYQLRQIFTAAQCPAQYLRINGPLLDASHEMDNATPENIVALASDGQRIADEADEEIDKFIKFLVPT